jgi:phosphohistidine phosphatase SixA
MRWQRRLKRMNFITPDDAPGAVSDWLLEQPEGAPIILVSHMPLVGELAGFLVEGSPAQGVGFPNRCHRPSLRPRCGQQAVRS